MSESSDPGAPPAERLPGGAAAVVNGGAAGGIAAPAHDRQIARNSLLNLAGRFVSVVGWTLIAPRMLHALGAPRFGLWSLLTVISGLYTTFDFGIAGSLTRFVAEFRASGDRTALRAAWTAASGLYLVLGLSGIALVALARPWLLDAFHVAPAMRPEAGAALLAAAIVYGVLNFYQLQSSVVSGLHRIDLWNRVSIVVTLLQLGGILVVLRLSGGLVALMVNTGVALLAGTVILTRLVVRMAPEIGFTTRGISGTLLRRLTRYSVALQVINLGVLFQFQLDKVLFGTLVSLAAVASYEFGYRVTSALWSVPALMLPPLLPAVADLDARGERERIRRLYRRASRYVFAAGFPIAAGMIALAPVLFQAWLGPGHRDAVRATIALAAMLAWNLPTGVGSAIVRGIGRPGLEVRYQVLAMVLHLALGIALIRAWGFAGGLVALVASIAVASTWFVVLFHRAMDEPIAPFLATLLARPVLVSVVAGAAAAGLVRIACPDLAALSRAQAAGWLLAGAGVCGGVALAGLLVTRYTRGAELGRLLALAIGRGAAAGAGA